MHEVTFMHHVLRFLPKKVKSHQRIKQMKRTRMKQNQLDPLNPLTIPGFFRGVVLQFSGELLYACV